MYIPEYLNAGLLRHVYRPTTMLRVGRPAGVSTHMKLKPLKGTSGLSRSRIMTLTPFLSIAVLTAPRMRYRLAHL